MTVLLEVPTQEQLDKLRQEYKVLGILTPDQSSAIMPTSYPDFATLAGSISAATAERWQQEVKEMRNEWERDF